MRDAVKYVSADGNEIELWSVSIIGNYKAAKLWSYDIDGGHLFDAEKNFDALIVVRGRALADMLIDTLESDSARNRFGRLYINDWFIRVKFAGLTDIVAEKNDLIKITVSFYAKFPNFMHAVPQQLDPILPPGQPYLDYDYDYDHDYAAELYTAFSIYNNQVYNADFIITINGAVGEVDFNIGEHRYFVDLTVQANERLIIDSVNKQVYIIQADGTIVDAMEYVSDTSYIFEPIPPGSSAVSWNFDFNSTMEVVLYEQRKMPTWMF